MELVTRYAKYDIQAQKSTYNAAIMEQDWRSYLAPGFGAAKAKGPFHVPARSCHMTKSATRLFLCFEIGLSEVQRARLHMIARSVQIEEPNCALLAGSQCCGFLVSAEQTQHVFRAEAWSPDNQHAPGSTIHDAFATNSRDFSQEELMATAGARSRSEMFRDI